MASLIPSANASGTGSMTLAGPSTNSNQTVTIPDTTGTMMVSGNMPAFSAYAQGNQSVANNTWTKVALAYEEFDTNNNFNTTLYRFTPTVAGYYQINGQIGGNATGINPTLVACAIYKNGAIYKEYITTGNSVDYQMGLVSSVIYFNGSTDYVELYGYLRSATAVISGESSYVITWMNGAMIRSA
jgi:hypothetical protein